MKLKSSVTVFILGLENKFRGNELHKVLLNHGLKVVIFFGFDGNTSQIPQDWRDDKRSLRLYRKILSNQEIACSFGHKSMFDLAVKENSDYSLFLEDDVTCVSIRKFEKFISKVNIEKPEIWIFPATSEKIHSGVKFSSSVRTFIEKQSIPSGAFAYLMNRQALRLIEQGYSKYGFQGYVADFPTFFPDFIKFKRGAPGIFALDEVDSVLGELRLRRRSPANAFDYIKVFADLLYVNWLISSYKDCGLKGFFKLRHINILLKIMKIGTRIG
jgi:GR25 family glycosyltransferase involved in LPS biosynthesis